MAATRSQVRRSKIVSHTVSFGDGVEVAFTFDANKMTDGWMEDWTKHEEDTNIRQLNAMLADLILSWDILEEENGPVVPITPEEIGKLFTLSDKFNLLKEFVGLPSDAEGNASKNTSSSASSDSSLTQVSPPNGQSPSPTPTPVASPSSPLPT